MRATAGRRSGSTSSSRSSQRACTGSRSGGRSGSRRSGRTRTSPGRARTSSRSTPRRGSGTRRSTSCLADGRRSRSTATTHDAPAGTVVHLADPSVRRQPARRPGTLVLAIGGKPGEPYTRRRGSGTSRPRGSAPRWTRSRARAPGRGRERFPDHVGCCSRSPAGKRSPAGRRGARDAPPRRGARPAGPRVGAKDEDLASVRDRFLERVETVAAAPPRGRRRLPAGRPAASGSRP